MSSNAEMIAEIAADLLGGIEDVDDAAVGLETAWPTVVELGWPLVAIDEARGGAGGAFDDLAAIITAIGRHTAAVPLLEQSLATWVLTEAGEQPPEDLVTVAVEEGLTASGDGPQVTVSGTLPAVPWLTAASRLIAPATLADDTEVLVVLDVAAPGLERVDEANLAGEPRSQVTCAEVAATVLTDAPGPELLRARGSLLATVALVGAMETAYELTRTHVKTREQFGRPLARFQVVSSALAEMSSEVSLARSAVDAAVEAYAADGDALELAIATARVLTVEATTAVNHHAHHLHGAMGITREYPLHKATRRVWSWRDEWGSERAWRRALGDRALSLGPEALWDEVTLLCDAGVVA